MAGQALWHLCQHFNALEDYRGEIRRVWRDDAAREMNARYFDPHESDGEMLQTELNDHGQTIERAGEHLATAGEHGQEAARQSAQVAQRLVQAEQERRTAYGHLELTGRARAEAVAAFPRIIHLIDEANHCCGGVAADPQGAEPTLRKNVNYEFAGQVKPVSERLRHKYPNGVFFDAEGFPDFSPYAVKTVRIQMTGDRKKDVAAAEQAAGYADTSGKYSWHHHQDRVTMQLVPRDLHRNIRHTGGVEQVNEMGVLAW